MNGFCLFGKQADGGIIADDVDYELSDRLFRSLAAKMSVPRRRSKKKWAVEFAKLRKAVQDDGTVRKVLDWYCVSVGSPYVPVALSASGFRKKFDAIKIAMGRDRVVDVLPSVEAKAKKVEDGISHLIWPDGWGGRDLHRAVVASVAEAEKMYRVLASSDKPALRRLFDSLPPVDEFIRVWFESVHNRLISGRRIPSRWRSFRASSPFWRDEARSFLAGFCGDPDLWDRVESELTENGPKSLQI